MRIEELKPGMMVMNRRRELFKISNVYEASVTAQVMLPLPPRTQVRTLLHHDIAQLKIASVQIVHEMEDAWGLAPLPTRAKGGV